MVVFPDFHWFGFQDLYGHDEFIAFFQLGDGNRLHVFARILFGSVFPLINVSALKRDPSTRPSGQLISGFKGGQPWVSEDESVPSQVCDKKSGSFLFPVL